MTASFLRGRSKPEPNQAPVVRLVRPLAQRAIPLARQKGVQGDCDEEILPYRVECRRPLSRFEFALPCVDQKLAYHDADSQLLITRSGPDPVR